MTLSMIITSSQGRFLQHFIFMTVLRITMYINVTFYTVFYSLKSIITHYIGKFMKLISV